MAALFLLWAIVIATAWLGHRREAMILAGVAMLLCVAMLVHHMTSSIAIDL